MRLKQTCQRTPSPICKTKPPLALVKLLKVLDRHPELLNEVGAA